MIVDFRLMILASREFKKLDSAFKTLRIKKLEFRI